MMPYYQDCCYIATSENVNNLSDRCYHSCLNCECVRVYVGAFFYVCSVAATTVAVVFDIFIFAAVAVCDHEKLVFCHFSFDPLRDTLLLFAFVYMHLLNG